MFCDWKFLNVLLYEVDLIERDVILKRNVSLDDEVAAVEVNDD